MAIFTTDHLVIGAGPAGLQLGYFLQRAGRDYLILEAGEAPGTFFQTFPRHRKLISVNKANTGSDDPEINLRMDWNSLLSDDPELLFTRYSGAYFPAAEDLVRYLGDFAVMTGLRIRYGTRVVAVSRDEAFRVTDDLGNLYQARCVVVATGLGLSNIPDVPGIETGETYREVPIDPNDFLGQRVLVVGKGNSAFETADNLIETAAVIHVAGPGSIKMAWRSHYVGHLRAVNNNFLDTYQLKSQNALLDGNIKKIEKQDDGSYLVTFSFIRADEVTKDLRYDRVIVCTGFRFDDSIFAPDCRPKLTINDRFPDQTAAWESVNIPDLYFAGTLMQVRDYKKSTGGFIHGFRYAIRALHHILEQRYHGVAWPATELAAEPGTLMEAVLARVNRTSALWQQFAVLGDLVVVGSEGRARYHEEVPVDHVAASEFATADLCFVVTLEYGPGHDELDPFDITAGRISQNEVENSHEGRYLHPVVRLYRRGELAAVHHVTENLENDWTGPIHREPLRHFFARHLEPVPAAMSSGR